MKGPIKARQGFWTGPLPLKVGLTTTMYLCMVACGFQDAEKPFTFDYFFDDETINTSTLTLNMAIKNGDSYQFKLVGEGFNASAGLDEFTALESEVTLTYSEEQEYEAQLFVQRLDGTPYLEDTLNWEYSLEVPPNPVVSFSEEATPDTRVWLRVSALKGANTTHVLIEGDTDTGEPLLLEIPSTLQVPFDTSEEDGLKVFTVKYVNKFETESNPVTVSILKKSTLSTGCNVVLSDNVSADSTVRLQATATDSVTTYLNLSGNLASPFAERSFVSSTLENLTLEFNDQGQAAITASIRDTAGNVCYLQTLTVTKDPDFVHEGISIADNALTTEVRPVDVNFHYMDLPLEPIEMYVDGDVDEDDNTFQWIDYAEQLTLTLKAPLGLRTVRVKYRKASAPEFETERYFTNIYLKPYVRVSGSSSPYTVEPAPILGLDAVTITGCAETYSRVAVAESYPCTASSGAIITMTYHLEDGTDVVKTAVTN